MEQFDKILSRISNIITTLLFIIAIVVAIFGVSEWKSNFLKLCDQVSELSGKVDAINHGSPGYDISNGGTKANVGSNKNVSIYRLRIFDGNQFGLSDGDVVEIINTRDERFPTIMLKVEITEKNKKEDTEADFTVNPKNLYMLGKTKDQVGKNGIFPVRIKVLKKVE